MTDTSASGEQGARRYSDRERFIAFSFCWAEAIIELADDRTITFAGGILPMLTGKDPRVLKGMPILDIIADEDRPLAEQMLDAIARTGRFDNIHLRFKGANGSTQPLVTCGYRNPELENRYFLAFHMAGGLSTDKSLKKTGKEGLYDADSFGKMASKMLAEGVDGADKMTLVELDGLAEAQEEMDEAQRENLMGAVGSVLKMSSVNGDAAAKLGDGKYGVVHGQGLDVDAMKARISSLIQNIAPEAEGISVGAATIDAGDGLTEENLTKGVIHALNEFSKSKGGAVSLEALSGSMDDLVKDAMETAETFNRVVKKSDFRMAMHPIIGIKDGVIHHYEALARFQGKHGESPYKYITFAEETGLIGAFDLSVIDKVMAWIDENKDAPMFASVAVNISGNSIVDKRYIDGLQDRLKANPWTQGKLIFELTESSRVEDLETANEFIQNL
ncbi:MAG: EAL domain-containing protein, partial [Rhodospirillales bacterium]